jgi:hypothetical protein
VEDEYLGIFSMERIREFARVRDEVELRRELEHYMLVEALEADFDRLSRA